MRQLGALGWQGFVVEFLRRVRVQREIELVFPAELEARFAQGVVPNACREVALGQVSGVRGEIGRASCRERVYVLV